MQVMLAQAQECMVEKVVNEKKKSSMIMKLASQAAHGYGAALEQMLPSEGPLKGFFPQTWILAVRVSLPFVWKFLSSSF